MSEDARMVRLGDRYVAAWGEVQFRIAQRQNALQIYVTLASAIIAVLFHGVSAAAIDPQLFSLLIPFVSVSFAFLNFKHERTIGILRKFLKKCELLNNPGDENSRLPGYHTDTGFNEAAQKVRRYHDWASAVLVALFNIIGLVVAHASFKVSFDIAAWPFFVYVISTLGAVGFLFWASRGLSED